MIIAISIWNDRIAPVFDVARRLRLLTIENGRITTTTEVPSAEESLQARATQLLQCQVRTLICGAISRELESMIADSGIHLIPFTAGEATAVAHNWLSGQLLKSDHYLMPGCCRRHKNRIHAARCGHGEEQNRMALSRNSNSEIGGHGHPGGAKAKISGARFCGHCGYRESSYCSSPCHPGQCPRCGDSLKYD